jgi:hypothetical protein
VTERAQAALQQTAAVAAAAPAPAPVLTATASETADPLQRAIQTLETLDIDLGLQELEEWAPPA